ncbi:MAG TPA: exopolysaccharide biosynthesis polyprenyl glycosylphosphotransferase [Mucilaginibacter sp.]|nr:exopolysaccharide biosynthesis polyprenyl glycosylphosphotransferase [Mucilaginibacter sp.]
MSARIFKRSFDIIFSLFIILFIFSWLCPIIVILIKMESPGPVFFIQIRTGRDNVNFRCFKFRSMYVNSEADRKQATRDDSRVTRIGAFLRKTSLDELPQFFNVLIGNMSIVGPRPHMLSHTEKFSRITEQYVIRHTLRPGITGWAQVCGLRGELSDHEAVLQRVHADVWYLENWSFLLDVKIILLTFWITLKGDKNAY